MDCCTAGFRGVCDDARIASRLAGFDEPSRLDAVEHGHRDVHHYDGRLPFVRGNQSIQAILGCSHKEASLKQRFGDKHAGILDIVDHQHGRDRMGAGVGPTKQSKCGPRARYQNLDVVPKPCQHPQQLIYRTGCETSLEQGGDI